LHLPDPWLSLVSLGRFRVMVDRTSTDEVAKTFEYLFPDLEIRRVCVAALADSVATAHAAAAHRWGVTVLDDMVRLNVGKIEVLTLWLDWIHIVLDSRDFPGALIAPLTFAQTKKIWKNNR
jgi:hypothetical protein